jgi:hypothetical protein
MNSRTVSLLCLLPLLLAGCQTQAASTPEAIIDPQSTGVLFGSVTKGPLSSVVLPGQSGPPSGVAGAQVDIATADGRPLKSVESDSDGGFRVSLPVGTYRVSMPSLYGAMFTKDLPATITIVAGREYRLDIHLDTGIR